MRKLLILLMSVIIASAMTSCVTQNKCNQKFPPQISEVHDTVVKEKITIVKHDTTIYLPGEKVKIIDHAYCDSLGRAQMAKKTVISKTKHGDVKASVEIKDNIVTVECAEDSLMAIQATLYDTIKELKTTIKNTKETVNTVVQYETHWYDTFCHWFTFISLLIGLLIAVFFIGRTYLKTVT